MKMFVASSIAIGFHRLAYRIQSREFCEFCHVGADFVGSPLGDLARSERRLKRNICNILKRTEGLRYKLLFICKLLYKGSNKKYLSKPSQITTAIKYAESSRVRSRLCDLHHDTCVRIKSLIIDNNNRGKSITIDAN